MISILKKLAKIVTIGMIIIVVITVLKGCSVSKEEKVKKLLAEKYSEEFEIISTRKMPTGGAIGEYYYQAICSPQSDSEILFEIEVYDFEEKRFDDTYPQGIVARELEVIAMSQLNEIFGDCYVNANVLTRKINTVFAKKEEVTIESYAENAVNPSVYYRIVINIDEYKETDFENEYMVFKQVLTELVRNGINGRCSIYFVHEEKRAEIEEFFKENISIHTTFQDMTKDLVDFGFNIYGDGLSVTKEEYVKMRKAEE